jgi:hypothetical protein
LLNQNIKDRLRWGRQNHTRQNRFSDRDTVQNIRFPESLSKSTRDIANGSGEVFADSKVLLQLKQSNSGIRHWKIEQLLSRRVQ